ncbi:heme o synthase [Camelliibacillus cellulosilyticus]|uniref:Protoheme IX farnesyltransferase n=1 Tax=Camelliibacillus cellulosilyticus TaxID=2174486 RepID=A0ABV9GH26_9BACL
MSKPVTSLNDTGIVERHSSVEAKTTASWKDFLTIMKMGIVTSNLITTFTGIWLALYFTNQSFLDNIWKVIAALAGSALIMAGGCALNNFIDRDIDQLMERTKERPSATGGLTPRQVVWTGIILSALGTILLLQTSFIATVFGLIGLFVYVVVYTMWLKRTHSINTIVGGIAGAMPPLIGWAAIDPQLASMVPWLLFLVMFLWQPPHFLALAMKRVEEYRKAGIPMLPVVAGFGATKRQMIVYVAALFPASLLLYELGPLYLIVAVVLGAGWLAIGLAGFFAKDVMKWSKRMFVFSLNYMTLLFVVMILSVLF